MSDLLMVRNAAQEKGVGFDCVYCESDDSWYFRINSTAPSEEWTGKNRSFECALDDVFEALIAL